MISIEAGCHLLNIGAYYWSISLYEKPLKTESSHLFPFPVWLPIWSESDSQPNFLLPPCRPTSTSMGMRSGEHPTARQSSWYFQGNVRCERSPLELALLHCFCESPLHCRQLNHTEVGYYLLAHCWAVTRGWPGPILAGHTYTPIYKSFHPVWRIYLLSKVRDKGDPALRSRGAAI